MAVRWKQNAEMILVMGEILWKHVIWSCHMSGDDTYIWVSNMPWLVYYYILRIPGYGGDNNSPWGETGTNLRLRQTTHLISCKISFFTFLPLTFGNTLIVTSFPWGDVMWRDLCNPTYGAAQLPEYRCIFLIREKQSNAILDKFIKSTIISPLYFLMLS